MPAEPLPLSVGLICALAAVYGRELAWVAPNVAREVEHWRARALAIPDPVLREDALLSLERERLHVEGAALFCALPRRRDRTLLRVLATYQIVHDYLDTLSERPCDELPQSGPQLHRALVEALDPQAPLSDYYRHHPWRDDGGYLRSLVETCRDACAALPGYGAVRERAVRLGRHFIVQVANHDPLAARRDAQLAAWAREAHPGRADASWFELAAAASSTLGIHALLTLAVEPAPRAADVAAVDAAYVPWVCAASTLLDSFVDRADDLRTGDHSYLAHYDDDERAARRLEEIVVRAVGEVGRLPRGRRHAVLVAGMVAMYLSKTRPQDAAASATARRIRQAAGGLVALELPLLRALRRVHRVGAA